MTTGSIVDAIRNLDREVPGIGDLSSVANCELWIVCETARVADLTGSDQRPVSPG